MACQLGADDLFGPQVLGCRQSFDFTLLFEQSIFQIAPCALLLLSVPIRASYLRKQNVKTLRSGLGPSKQLAIAALACTQLALLIVWSSRPDYRTRASIPAAVLSFVSSLVLIALSSIEHSRSVRPSAIINLYLLFSLLFDIPQARTLWLRPGPRSLPGIFTAGIAAKTIALLLEARSKGRSLMPIYRLYTPEALAGIYNKTVLYWLNPIFLRGWQDILTFEELYPIAPEITADRLEAHFNKQWAQGRGRGKHSLLWTLVRCLKTPMIAFIIPRLFLSAFKLSQPLLIHRITALLLEPATQDNTNIGRALIAATSLIYLGLAISTVLYKRELDLFLTRLRGILTTAIHAKILVLPYDKLSDNAAISLMNNDVQRVTQSLFMFDELFATPVEIAVAIYLLEEQIGATCVAPAGFALAISAISFLTSSKGVPYQKRWLKAVSERVAYTSSVLNCPKGFKMMGLADYLSAKVQSLRVHELNEYAAYRKFSTVRNVFAATPDSFCAPLTLMIYTLIHGSDSLNPTKAFTTLGLVMLVSSPIGELIHAVPLLQAALASIDRVQDFLLLETAGPRENRQTTSAVELTVWSRKIDAVDQSAYIALQEASVRLGAEGKLALQDISISFQAGSLSLVVGPVGSGKSTLLRAIIGDARVAQGSRHLAEPDADFAYCAQDPWLPNASVKQLITGHKEPEQQWLDTVMLACDLQVDIESFPEGIESIIGTRGLSLSGGQRQRLALARALYSRRPIMVVDDVLSGLDASTSQHVFENVFGPSGLCKTHGVTAIFATHASQYLPQSDHIIALNNEGRIEEQGSFAVLDSHDGYVHRLKIDAEASGDSGSKDLSPATPPQKSAAAAGMAVMQQDLARRTGDTAVYGYYLKSIGWKYCIISVFTTIGFATGLKLPDLWVKWWSQASQAGNHDKPLGLWIGVYFMFAVLALSSVGYHIWIMLVRAIPKSAAQLHKQLLDAVMGAPYSFWVKTDSGVTLNRFSSDMSLIEMDLAAGVLQTADAGAICLFGTVLIAIGSTYGAVTIPFMVLAVYMLQKIYLRTSRQVRFMNIEAQAPLMTHCQETLSGCITIRAFGWQRQNHETCQTLLDNSQRAFYLQQCLQRWLGLVLNLLTAAVSVIVITLAVEIRSSSSAGSVGVSLLNTLSFNQMLTILITAWTTLETSLGAVARIKNFEADTASESQPSEVHVPPPNWPESGALEVSRIHAAYDADGPDVLKDVSLSIKAGSKVGICGRTGSGKSSLLLTLLRLLDTSSGTTLLDGIDISTMPRQTLRERITALPQESVVLPGSLRSNVDPLGKSTDEEINTAFEKVGLLDIVTSRGGLDTTVAELSLSHGQMQLFAVARALLRPSKLLVLDEMTSSVDAITEEKMMDVMHDVFKESTIVAVAHRLKTIVDYDQVIVMDAGKVVEVGAPKDLLGKGDGYFRAMWDKSGH